MRAAGGATGGNESRFFTWCGEAGAQPDGPRLEKVHSAGPGLETKKRDLEIHFHKLENNLSRLIPES